MVSDDEKPSQPVVGSRLFKFVLIVLFILILVTLGYKIVNKVSSSNMATKNHGAPSIASTLTQKTGNTGCITQTITIGSSGNCVSDIQTMINYMESSGLTECPFNGGALLTIEGKYDEPTTNQVKVVQTWEDCYSKEEGGSTNITVNGNVSGSTWDELCTYAYHYPQAANSGMSIYRQASIAAGKDAGCAQLF